jgi:hypothetical protein
MVKLGVLPYGKATRAHGPWAVLYSLLRSTDGASSVGLDAIMWDMLAPDLRSMGLGVLCLASGLCARAYSR